MRSLMHDLQNWRCNTLFTLQKRLVARTSRNGTFIRIQKSDRDEGIPLVIIVHRLERLDPNIPRDLRDRYDALVQLATLPQCDCLKYDLLCLCT